MAKIDHHLHTTRHSPDSIIEPEVLIRRAREAGLDGVVITEHDRQWAPDELADLAARAEGLVVLSGVEVSAREGHFLVYGLPDTRDVGPGIGLAELLAVVRRHEAAIVAAHPFRWDQDFAGIVSAHGPAFDAVELASNNVSVETRRKAEELLRAIPMGTTGSSDGHEPDAIGCYYTEFPGPIRTMAEFVAAIRHQTGRPRHRAGAWQACGPID
ncbi:PHP domain-containing protein [Tundrisphaera sp. TA3]|uniref:PHP domain-containing protein n=1 Tax=Tundrisphaera sp. TA3 TaxID=3435775 RepID=UPI003EBA6255